MPGGGQLGPPIHVLENRDHGTCAGVYEVKGSKLSGKKYEVLKFDANDQCTEAIAVEVTARRRRTSDNEDPPKR